MRPPRYQMSKFNSYTTDLIEELDEKLVQVIECVKKIEARVQRLETTAKELGVSLKGKPQKAKKRRAL